MAMRGICQGGSSHEGPWGQNYFHDKTLSASFAVDICTGGAKAEVGKTAGALAGVKAVAPNFISGHCILHRHLLAGGEKGLFSLREALMRW